MNRSSAAFSTIAFIVLLQAKPGSRVDIDNPTRNYRFRSSKNNSPKTNISTM